MVPLQHGGYTEVSEMSVPGWGGVKPQKTWQHKNSQIGQRCGDWCVTYTPGDCSSRPPHAGVNANNMPHSRLQGHLPGPRAPLPPTADAAVYTGWAESSAALRVAVKSIVCEEVIFIIF